MTTLKIEKGKGKTIPGGEGYPLKDGSAEVIMAGVERNIINTSAKEDMELYSSLICFGLPPPEQAAMKTACNPWSAA